MLKEKLLPISFFCLAFAIIISAFIISKGMETNGAYVSSGLDSLARQLNVMNNNSSYNNSSYNNYEVAEENFGLSELGEYLRLSDSQLLKLVGDENSGIPYINIDGIYTFNRSAINKWLETVRLEIN